MKDLFLKNFPIKILALLLAVLLWILARGQLLK
jgi:YbbR domain-containing protein